MRKLSCFGNFCAFKSSVFCSVYTIWEHTINSKCIVTIPAHLPAYYSLFPSLTLSEANTQSGLYCLHSLKHFICVCLFNLICGFKEYLLPYIVLFCLTRHLMKILCTTRFEESWLHQMSFTRAMLFVIHMRF